MKNNIFTPLVDSGCDNSVIGGNYLYKNLGEKETDPIIGIFNQNVYHSLDSLSLSFFLSVFLFSYSETSLIKIIVIFWDFENEKQNKIYNSKRHSTHSYLAYMSLPLSSQMMKAGKFSTSIFHTASMPSWGGGG